MFFSQFLNGAPHISRKVLVCALLFVTGASSLQAKKANTGLAWQVRGTWQVAGAGAPVRDGDAIGPTSLLQPADTAGDHSITILLPDGQRVLYECFTVADCARGFRVPSLISKPDAFAVETLARVGAILSRRHDASPGGVRTGHAPQTTRQEAVAILNPANRVRVAGLVGDLPKGRYTYSLRPLSQAHSSQFHLVLEKEATPVEFALPAPGLYDITITDALDTPRVDLFLAALRPNQSTYLQSFHRARAMMEKWNDDYAGWPIDDFLRAYLESLMQNAKPRAEEVR